MTFDGMPKIGGYMKKIIGLFLLAACATTLPGPSAGDPTWDVGTIQFEKQENKLWCGAAVARVLLSQIKTPPSQKEIISKVHGMDCSNSSSTRCAQPIEVWDALSKYGIAYIRNENPTFDYVVGLIKSGKPVAIKHYYAHGTAGSTTHMQAAVAAFEHAGKAYIQVYNPLTNKLEIWDDSYVTGNMAWDAAVSVK